MNVNPDTTLSVSILCYQCQSRHNFICINTLLSMLIPTQLYLYQYFTINVNPDTTLSVSIPNLVLSFKTVIQDAFCLLIKKNYSLAVVKAKSISNYMYVLCYKLKLINVITSFTSLYTT